MKATRSPASSSSCFFSASVFNASVTPFINRSRCLPTPSGFTNRLNLTLLCEIERALAGRRYFSRPNLYSPISRGAPTIACKIALCRKRKRLPLHPQFAALKTHLAEVHDLNKVRLLLGWDQRTMMPAKGARVRAETLATMERVWHERATDPELGRLLDALASYEASLPYDSDEASLIRVARYDYDKARRVPGDLRAAMARAAALGNTAWIEARKQSDFGLFLPHLQELVALKHQYVECFDETEHVFDDLKSGLVPLIAAIAQRGDAVDDRCLHGHFPVEKQREFCVKLIEHFGFRADSWRLDPTVHPFASSNATTDIRITTRYYEDYLGPALFGSMHECGHGLYENGVSPALERTPLCRGASQALHESQSRMWENLVGRSRPFWQYFFPRLQATFPEQLQGVDAEASTAPSTRCSRR